MDEPNNVLHYPDKGRTAPRRGGRAVARRQAAEIPSFVLYGEDARGAGPELEPLHLEFIHTRSRRHDWTIQPHTHAGLVQILVLLEGSVEARLDDETRKLPAGTVLTIPPGLVHGFHFQPDSQGFVLTLTEAHLLAAPLASLRGALPGVLLRPVLIELEEAAERDRVAALLAQLLAEFEGSRSGRALLLEWLAWSVLAVLLRQPGMSREAGDAAGRSPALLARYQGLIDAHYREHWALARYAAALHVTESRLNRLCRSLAGCSAHQLIQRRLLLEAKRRLTYVVVPVSLLAEELGFEDPAYFCRFFRRHTGVSPSEYRKAVSMEVALS